MTTWLDTWANMGLEIEASQAAARDEFLAGAPNPPVPGIATRALQVASGALSQQDVTELLHVVWGKGIARAIQKHIGPVSSDGSVTIGAAIDGDGVYQLDLKATPGEGASYYKTPWQVDFAAEVGAGTQVALSTITSLNGKTCTLVHGDKLTSAVVNGSFKDWTYGGHVYPGLPGLCMWPVTPTDVLSAEDTYPAPRLEIPLMQLFPSGSVHSMADLAEVWVWFKIWSPVTFVLPRTPYACESYQNGSSCGIRTIPYASTKFIEARQTVSDWGRINFSDMSSWTEGAEGVVGPQYTGKIIGIHGTATATETLNIPGSSSGYDRDGANLDNVIVIRIIDMCKLEFYSATATDPEGPILGTTGVSTAWPDRSALHLVGQGMLKPASYSLWRHSILTQETDLAIYFAVDNASLGSGEQKIGYLRQIRVDYALSGQAGGGGGGPATQMIETGGPATLDISAISDGQMLVRSGATIVGASIPRAADEAFADVTLSSGGVAGYGASRNLRISGTGPLTGVEVTASVVDGTILLLTFAADTAVTSMGSTSLAPIKGPFSGGSYISLEVPAGEEIRLRAHLTGTGAPFWKYIGGSAG